MFENIFRIIAEKFPDAGVDCLLIGGFAVNHYGYTRNTLDVDFMIAGAISATVRNIMRDSGFTNLDEKGNVLFCSLPDGGPRIDFLKVDESTLKKLRSNAHEVAIRGYPIRVPALPDLIAMKIFSLAQDTERRMAKDLPDIAYLAVLNHLDLETDIKPLCDKYGTPIVFDMIRNQMEALQ